MRKSSKNSAKKLARQVKTQKVGLNHFFVIPQSERIREEFKGLESFQ